jgi:hypothetical protein
MISSYRRVKLIFIIENGFLIEGVLQHNSFKGD